jgi:hypothetical protein
VALVDVETQGLNPRDNRDELMELVKLQRLHQDAEADRFVEASRLATRVRTVSKVLEDLGTSSIPGIPQDPHIVGDVLGAVDVILEHVKEVYDSGYGPWD